MTEPAPLSSLGDEPLRRPLRERVADEILAAAARVIATQGEQASMTDIATAAGVGRATLYRYFPNRETLIEHLRTRALDRARTGLDASRVGEVDPLEGLARAVRAFVEIGQPLAIAARDRERAGGAFDSAVVAPLRTIIERGQAAGTMRTDMSATWLAESLLGLTIGAMSAGGLGKEDLIASVVGLFVAGAGS